MTATKIKAYYMLIKPGIIRGNLLAATAGYLLASAWDIEASVFIALVCGLTLVIASACVLNNIIDRDIDRKMPRTKKRALVSGEISVTAAWRYAAVLSLLGFLLLVSWTNWYVVGAGALGAIFYVGVYGYAKRASHHGTLVGTVSGSMPLVAGYLAVTNRIDTGAILLVLLMTAWQMPHFYAIALRRQKEYRAAGIPILPLIKGERRTQREMVAYVFLFTIVVVLLTQTGYTGATFLFVMGPLSLYWLWRGVQYSDDIKAWGGQMFGLSLVVLLVMSVMLSVGSILP